MFELTVDKLAHWRVQGTGPVYVKLGKGKNAPVRYHLRDVLRFVNEGRRYPSSVRAGIEETDGTQAAR